MFKLVLKKYIRKIIMKFDTNNQVCNKHNKEDFRECLKKCISVGTNFEILELFMKNHGFATYKNPLDENNRFYFIWSSNGLGNYKIGVIGQCDTNKQIVEIKVI